MKQQVLGRNYDNYFLSSVFIYDVSKNYEFIITLSSKAFLSTISSTTNFNSITLVKLDIKV